MNKEIDIVVDAEIGFDLDRLKSFVFRKEGIPEDSPIHFVLKRRSIDARSKVVKTRILADVYEGTREGIHSSKLPKLQKVAQCEPVLIIGAGPAGIFAAIKCIEFGLKPIIIERGKDVKSRRRDLAAINKEHIVNPDSNYCFGEGGAGTYSDGKLYTRSTKRGDVQRILQIMYAHGAREEILFDAHPHIGTNKLPKLIESLRETILDCGAEIYFNERVVSFEVAGKVLKGVHTASGKKFAAKATILATGHSARDIFELLHKSAIRVEPKPFALGVRVEHQQSLIDKIQYNCEVRPDFLPAASYSLNTQIKGGKETRGAFSFCMCPGGFIVPSATATEEVVVNGMSPSRRDSKYSNSGIVLSVELKDVGPDSSRNPLAAMNFQKDVEHKAWLAGGRTQRAPAQRLEDFVSNRYSNSLLDCSYQPGLVSVKMDEVLPGFIAKSLREAFKHFGKKMKGYLNNDAQIVGVESRTSSPVRIPRKPENCEHIEIKGLFPCGEGAGFAGGIMSAAMDGERCVEGLKSLYY